MPASLLSNVAAPVLFVAIWSTGFVVARAITPHADPNLFLFARFVLASALFGALALTAGAAWPRGRALGGHLVAGALLSGVYMCGTYWAVSHGLAAGVMALFGSLQPLFAALIAIVFLRERVTPRAWAGLAVGLAGVGLVIAPRVLASGPGAVSPFVVAVGLLAILGATLVAGHAGDIISQVTQAMTAGTGLARLGETVFPYPTTAEVLRKAADAWNRRKLTPTAKRAFGLFFRARG